jgi:hypothetical protein
MSTMMLELEDEALELVERAAHAENKPVPTWLREHIQREAERALRLAALEAEASRNGYPSGWLGLYGSLADDLAFDAPPRTPPRPVEALDAD